MESTCDDPWMRLWEWRVPCWTLCVCDLFMGHNVMPISGFFLQLFWQCSYSDFTVSVCVSFSSLVAWYSVPHWRVTCLHSEAAGFRVRLLEAWLCHFLAVGYWQLFNHASASSFMTECWWQPSWQLLWELNDLVFKNCVYPGGTQ